jgi:hypothetical protein
MHMMIHFGMTVGIKIQSMVDVITNSSTSVFTLYSVHDKNTIRDIVDAILAVNGNLRFDDLFDIRMMWSESAAQYLWEDSTELQQQFPNDEDFYNYLETLADEELLKYERMWNDDCSYNYDYYTSFFDGYIVTLKEGLEKTPVLESAISAIHRLDSIFEHDASFG